MANFLSNIYHRIKSIFTSYSYDLKEKEFEHRLEELVNLQKTISHNFNSTTAPALPTVSSERYTIGNIEKFSPKDFGSTLSMSELWKEREEKERQRIARIEKSVADNLKQVHSYIANEDCRRAEAILSQISGLIHEVTKDDLHNGYREECKSLQTLKDLLHQREVEAERERQRKLEEERRIRREQEEAARRQQEFEEAERIRRIHEEEERKAAKEKARLQELERLTSLAERRSADADEIAHYLSSNSVWHFYHFTDKRNVELIKKQGGLFSWEYSQQNDIAVRDYGGDEFSRSLDLRHNLQDYVRLSFCSNHPMAYRKWQEGSELVLLEIDVKVAEIEGVLFSNMNAAASDHYHGLGIASLKKVNILATKQNYVSHDDPIFAERQAECMVKTFIPAKYITNLDCPRTMKF